MKCLISKADVLETYAELYDTFEDNRFIRKELNKVYDKLNGLPYAQPEPCEDTVSRKDVETEIANLLKRVFVEYEDIAKKATAKLPSVTPKRKTGKWLINSDGYYPYCSECKAEPKSGEMTDFCPNCGADMRGERDGR